MKRYLLLLTALLTLISCEQDLDFNELDADKMPKVEICHYDSDSDSWITLKVNGNALKAHLKHGDFEGSCDRQTYIPDDGFEWYLVYYGYDDVMDNYVLTKNISKIEEMYWDDACCTSPWIDYTYDIQVKNMTGIEDFISLKKLVINDHQVIRFDIELDRLPKLEIFTLRNSFPEVDLDFSQNPNLKELIFVEGWILHHIDLSNNINLTKIIFDGIGSSGGINLKNGTNDKITLFEAYFSDSSNPCIQVDNINFSNSNWTLVGGYFAENCGF